MAAGLRRCLGIDIGSHSIKVADVSLTRAGIMVHKLASAELELAPGAPEAERENKVARVLRELLKKNRIASRAAVFCVPGQQTFLRRLPALPQTTEARLRRIIDYEANNLVPFPPDKSLRRYQVADSPSGTECEVLLAAMKRDHINQFMRTVARTGLKPLQISVGPLALHNFYRFCDIPFISPEKRRQMEKEEAKRKELEKKEAEARKKGKGKAGKGGKDAKGAKDEEEEDGEPEKKTEKKSGFSLGSLFGKKGAKGADKSAVAPEAEQAALVNQEGAEEGEEPQAPHEEEIQKIAAYVNIGARNMDLSIPKYGGGLVYGFSRSVPLAGDEMTLAIQREKSLASFGDAEELKRSRAVVVPPDTAPESLPKGVDVQASIALTKVVDRMIIELRRSLDFFISQPDGVAVDSICLSGGHAALAGLRDYMEERLGIPVVLSSEIKSESVKASAEDAPTMAPYLIAIGLGVEGVGYGALTIDFLPEEFQVTRTVKKKAPAIFVMAACLAGMIALSSQLGRHGIEVYRRAAEELEAQIAMIERQKWGEQYDKATAARIETDAQFALLGRAFSAVNRDYWFNFIAYVQEKKPKDIVIARMDLGGAGLVFIQGWAEERASPPLFSKSLGVDPQLVRKAELRGVQENIRVPFFPKPVYGFQIDMLLNKTARILTPPPYVARSAGAGSSAAAALQDAERRKYNRITGQGSVTPAVGAVGAAGAPPAAGAPVGGPPGVGAPVALPPSVGAPAGGPPPAGAPGGMPRGGPPAGGPRVGAPGAGPAPGGGEGAPGRSRGGGSGGTRPRRGAVN